jgi:quinoprotein glucose dehydrogenase
MAVNHFRSLRSNGQFTPPSLQGTLLSPGFDGGGEYGGVSFDPVSQTAYINSNNVAAIIQLIERDERQKVLSRRDLYLQKCSSCHGADLGGSPPSIPSLKGIAGRMSVYDVSRTILYGGGRMPSFAKLGGERINALSKYVVDQENSSLGDGGNNSPDQELGRRFSINGYQSFKDIDGYPAVKPPWGLLSALDLQSGRYRWQVPFGEYPELKKTMPGRTGSENYGGSVVTSTGVLFIGATIYDNKFRAIDTRNGRELWSYDLPAAALGTPLIYSAAGEQYVVVAAGGGKNPKIKTRAVYMAFKLGSPGSKAQFAAERPNDR